LYLQTILASFEQMRQGVTSPTLQFSRPGLLTRQILLGCESALALVCVAVMSLPGSTGRPIRSLDTPAAEERPADP
jgi:hypothetical protein